LKAGTSIPAFFLGENPLKVPDFLALGKESKKCNPRILRQIAMGLDMRIV